MSTVNGKEYPPHDDIDRPMSAYVKNNLECMKGSFIKSLRINKKRKPGDTIDHTKHDQATDEQIKNELSGVVTR